MATPGRASARAAGRVRTRARRGGKRPGPGRAGRYRVVPVALIVQKYGGTSVADADRIKAVAEHVAFTRRQGHDLVVVVSAMGKETDNLIALAGAVSSTLPGREMDMLLTIGERKSMALVCMALADLDIDAVSFTGSQVGIITDNVHGKAKILEVKGDRVRDGPGRRQGLRGGGLPGRVDREGDHDAWAGGRRTSRPWRWPPPSTPTAARSTRMSPGVYSADPRIVPQARKLARIHFDEMLEMAGRRGHGCWRCARWSSPATTASPCTCAPASPGSRARGSTTRSRAWKTRSSPEWSTTCPSRRSR